MLHLDPFFFALGELGKYVSEEGLWIGEHVFVPFFYLVLDGIGNDSLVSMFLLFVELEKEYGDCLDRKSVV